MESHVISTYKVTQTIDTWKNAYVLSANHTTSRCRQGRAFLFENAVNVTVGPEERLMMSGMHTVAGIFCCGCGQLLGWKYMVARDKTQKYKEGKVVLERWRINEEFNLDAPQNSSDPEYP